MRFYNCPEPRTGSAAAGREIVRECSGLSRMERARTVCALLRWRRPNGRLKAGAAKRRLRER